jgi:hypothetical protein
LLELQSSEILPLGTTSESLPNGNFTVQLIDASGALITEVRRYADFNLYARPQGKIPTPGIPFLISLANQSSARKISFSLNGKPIGTVDVPGTSTPISIKDVCSTIRNLLDSDFTKDAGQRRKALSQKCDAVQKSFAKGKINGTFNKLRFDLLKHVDQWVMNAKRDLLKSMINSLLP